MLNRWLKTLILSWLCNVLLGGRQDFNKPPLLPHAHFWLAVSTLTSPAHFTILRNLRKTTELIAIWSSVENGACVVHTTNWKSSTSKYFYFVSSQKIANHHVQWKCILFLWKDHCHFIKEIKHGLQCFVAICAWWEASWMACFFEGATFPCTTLYRMVRRTSWWSSFRNVRDLESIGSPYVTVKHILGDKLKSFHLWTPVIIHQWDKAIMVRFQVTSQKYVFIQKWIPNY